MGSSRELDAGGISVRESARVLLAVGVRVGSVARYPRAHVFVRLEAPFRVRLEVRPSLLHEPMVQIDAVNRADQSATEAVSPAALSVEPSARRTRTIAGVTLIDPPKPAAIEGVDTVGRFMLACLSKAPGEETAGGAHLSARAPRRCSP
jgi:hypothetical protein